MAQDSQDQVLSTKEMYLFHRDREHGISDKDRRQKMREKGNKEKGYLSGRGKGLPWIERRQT